MPHRVVHVIAIFVTWSACICRRVRPIRIMCKVDCKCKIIINRLSIQCHCRTSRNIFPAKAPLLYSCSLSKTKKNNFQFFSTTKYQSNVFVPFQTRSSPTFPSSSSSQFCFNDHKQKNSFPIEISPRFPTTTTDDDDDDDDDDDYQKIHGKPQLYRYLFFYSVSFYEMHTSFMGSSFWGEINFFVIVSPQQDANVVTTCSHLIIVISYFMITILVSHQFSINLKLYLTLFFAHCNYKFALIFASIICLFIPPKNYCTNLYSIWIDGPCSLFLSFLILSSLLFCRSSWYI